MDVLASEDKLYQKNLDQDESFFSELRFHAIVLASVATITAVVLVALSACSFPVPITCDAAFITMATFIAVFT